MTKPIAIYLVNIPSSLLPEKMNEPEADGPMAFKRFQNISIVRIVHLTINKSAIKKKMIRTNYLRASECASSLNPE